MKDCVLVSGGAGYVGSHVVHALVDAGWGVAVIDDLSTGRREAVPADVPLVVGDIGDQKLVERVICEHGCRAVMHFAGSVVVEESLADPLKYYRNNTCASRSLIEACVALGVGALVFSSTAAVYGLPEVLPVPESARTRPINPYGWSKLMTEWMLRDSAAASGLRYVALRYFNVAGADPRGRTGQSTPSATHLIKVACEAACGLRQTVSIFGEDYDTPDGTCIRDFIHVSDLAAAHLLALEHLMRGGGSRTFNCGYGHGVSVRDVLTTLEEVAGRRLPVTPGARRPGDAPVLVADSRRIREELGWLPRNDDLRDILATALAWESRRAASEAAA